MPKSVIQSIAFLFTLVVLIAVTQSDRPAFPDAPRSLYGRMLSGDSRTHHAFGSEFAPYRPLLPEKGAITFIMDFAFSPYARSIDQLYRAQSHLVPLLLNPKPGETAGLVYCSSDAIAEKRLDETGYRMLFPVENGKGVAIRSQEIS